MGIRSPEWAAGTLLAGLAPRWAAGSKAAMGDASNGEFDLSKGAGVLGSDDVFVLSPRLPPLPRHRDEQIEQYPGEDE